jgi:hypothetical protein
MEEKRKTNFIKNCSYKKVFDKCIMGRDKNINDVQP